MDISYHKVNNIPVKLYKANIPRGTVIAVHGFGGSKESASIQALAQRSCCRGLNVLAADLPAHGERAENADSLEVSKCISELIAVEEYARAFGGELFAFATSFGGMCMLHRLERLPDSYKKIVLRVPAVDMAESLLKVAAATDKSFSLEDARQNGFRITLGREYNIPYRFYEQLLELHCKRSSDVWNNSRLMTVYAENDELVCPHATEEFLRCNPQMGSLCIKGSGHRMAQPNHLDQALNAAAAFFLT